MEFKLNQTEKEKIEKLLETNENNYNISEMYLYYYYNCARDIKKNDIDAMIKFNKLNNKEAFFYSLMSLLEIDISDQDSLHMAMKYCYDGIHQLEISDYQNNPYLKNIKLSNSNLSNIRINYDSYLPYEGFPSNDLIVDEENFFQEQYQIGYFKEKYTFQSISHDKITWMSIIPNEIETMKRDIEIVNGNVLVYGLGLGYFAYMISLKEDVKSITIIEKDTNIINLFKKVIFPQFTNKEKIKIINQDAFDFEKNNQEKFDFAYVDLYHGSEDGIEIYLKFKELELRSNNYLYWLENSLINVIRRNIITIIYEQFNKIECNYSQEENTNDRIINNLYQLLQNKTFTSYNEIHSLLTSESIKNLVKNHHLI